MSSSRAMTWSSSRRRISPWAKHAYRTSSSGSPATTRVPFRASAPSRRGLAEAAIQQPLEDAGVDLTLVESERVAAARRRHSSKPRSRRRVVTRLWSDERAVGGARSPHRSSMSWSGARTRPPLTTRAASSERSILLPSETCTFTDQYRNRAEHADLDGGLGFPQQRPRDLLSSRRRREKARRVRTGGVEPPQLWGNGVTAR